MVQKHPVPETFLIFSIVYNRFMEPRFNALVLQTHDLWKPIQRITIGPVIHSMDLLEYPYFQLQPTLTVFVMLSLLL